MPTDPVAPGTQAPLPAGEATGDATGGAPAPTREKDLLDRLAALGREREAERQRSTRVEQQLQGLQQQLYAQQQAQQQREHAEFEARLAQLSPAEAAAERAKYAQQLAAAAYQNSVRAASAPPPAPTRARDYSPEEIAAERERKSREILAEVNAKYGLGDEGVRADDLDEAAWQDPKTFAAAAASAARLKARDPEVQAKAKARTPEGMREEIKREVLAELGVSRSLSADPAAERREPGADDVAKLAAHVDPHFRGIGSSLTDLKKYREELAGRVPRE